MTFLSAKKLKITELQREALIKTLVYLKEGCIQPYTSPIGKFTVVSSSTRAQMGKKPMYFHMSSWHDEMVDYHSDQHCGTVCCIGGTAEILTPNVRLRDTSSNALYNLFYPDEIYDWEKIKLKHAVKALNNYLTTGSAKWTEVMKK